MSGWRRKALGLLPERAEDIRRSQSIYDLLLTLSLELRHAYTAVPPNRLLIDRVFDFVGWCFGPRQNRDLRNAAAVGFYEHIGNLGSEARRDLAERLSPSEVAELQPLFHQMLEPQLYDSVMAEIEAAKARPRRVLRSAT